MFTVSGRDSGVLASTVMCELESAPPPPWLCPMTPAAWADRLSRSLAAWAWLADLVPCALVYWS